MSRGTLCLLAASLCGCGVYMNNADRESSAREARALVDTATRDTDRVWDAMAANVEALEPAERAAIERAVGGVADLDRRLLYTWDWRRLRREAEDVLAADAGGVLELARDLAVVRARAQQARDELTLEIVPQLTTGSAWPDDEGPMRRALDSMGLAGGFDTPELSGAWPEPVDEALLAQLGVAGADRAADIDRLAGHVDRLDEALSRLRVLCRRTIEEGWPLDEACRLLRQSDHLDLFFGRPLGADEPLPAEWRTTLSQVGRIVERDGVEWATATPDDVRARLAPFDTRGELIGRRFQRDTLSTRSELLSVELEFLGRRAAQVRRRFAVLRERTAEAARILAFCDGPLGEIRLGDRAASLDDSVFVTVRHLIGAARESAAPYAEVPAAAGDGVEAMKAYNARLVAAARAVAAAAAYVRLGGELAVRAELERIESARIEHLASIERSRAAALGWKRLLDDGAAGLEAYWSGGLKGEDLAKLIFLAGEMITSTYSALR